MRIAPLNAETIAFDMAAYDRETMMNLYGMEYCCRCGACTAGCPVMAEHRDDFAGPAAMPAIAYRHLDPLDTGDRVMEAIHQRLYRCIECSQCNGVFHN